MMVIIFAAVVLNFIIPDICDLLWEKVQFRAKMELFIAPHCALLAVYDDASRSILAFSVLEL